MLLRKWNTYSIILIYAGQNSSFGLKSNDEIVMWYSCLCCCALHRQSSRSILDNMKTPTKKKKKILTQIAGTVITHRILVSSIATTFDDWSWSVAFFFITSKHMVMRSSVGTETSQFAAFTVVRNAPPLIDI